MVGGLVALVVALVLVRFAIRRFAPRLHLMAVGAHAGCDLADLSRVADDPVRLIAVVDAKLAEQFRLLCYRTKTVATPVVGASGDPYFVVPRLVNLASGELTLASFRQLHSIIVNDLAEAHDPKLDQIHDEFHFLAHFLDDVDGVRRRFDGPGRR